MSSLVRLTLAPLLGAVLAAGCAEARPAPPDDPPTSEEPAVTPDGAIDLRTTAGTVDAAGDLQYGLYGAVDGTAHVDLSTPQESLVARLPEGTRVQVGRLDVEVVDVGDDVATVRVLAEPLPPADPVVLPLPGRRTFGDEAGIGARTGDRSQLELTVRHEGRWEVLRLDLEVAEAELHGYRLEVLEVGEEQALVRVTAPDGVVLPRFEDDVAG